MALSKRAWIGIVICVVLGLLSFFLLGKVLSDPETFKDSIKVLDSKQSIIAGLSAASIAAASALDLLPGDAGQSVANALVDLGGFFVVLLATIYLEKILLSISGLITFRILIPLGLCCVIGFLVTKREGMKSLAIKLIVFGLALFLLVPTSVGISSIADQTHRVTVQNITESIEEDSDNIQEKSDSKDENVLKRFVTKAKEGASGVVNRFQGYFDQLVDNIAYLIVTTCVIPIAVLLILIVFLMQFASVLTGKPIEISTVMQNAKKLKEQNNLLSGRDSNDDVTV